jgi:hypothetical protein
MAEWEITANDQAKYKSIFQSCQPVQGLIGGEIAKVRDLGEFSLAAHSIRRF